MPVRREKLGREQKKREWRGSSHLCLLSCARQEDWTLKIQTANQAKVAFVLLYPFFISQGFIGICNVSGRKNVLRKLLRILYRRLKAGFSVCWLCCTRCERLLTVKHFCLTCLLFFRRLKITLDSEQPMLKEKRIIPSVLGGINGFEHFLRGEYLSDCASD